MLFRIIQYLIFLQTHLFVPHFFGTSTLKKNPDQFPVIEQLPADINAILLFETTFTITKL